MPRHTALVLVFAAAASVANLAACKSDSERARDKALDSASSFREELADMPGRIDTVVAKLKDTTSPSIANRTGAYDDFQQQLTYLGQDARRVGNEADSAVRDADAYFRAWNREAAKADPSKRAALEADATTRSTRYNTATSYLQDGKKAYYDLVGQLNDVNRKLRANLGDATSPDIQADVARIKMKAMDVKNYIARLTEHLDQTLAGR